MIIIIIGQRWWSWCWCLFVCFVRFGKVLCLLVLNCAHNRIILFSCHVDNECRIKTYNYIYASYYYIKIFLFVSRIEYKWSCYGIPPVYIYIYYIECCTVNEVLCYVLCIMYYIINRIKAILLSQLNEMTHHEASGSLLCES